MSALNMLSLMVTTEQLPAKIFSYVIVCGLQYLTVGMHLLSHPSKWMHVHIY